MAKDDNRALERLLQEIDKLSDEQFTKFYGEMRTRAMAKNRTCLRRRRALIPTFR